MKKVYLACLILFSFFYAKAQVDTTFLYINSFGNETSKSAPDTKYFRKIYWQDKWIVNDYYLDGVLQMKGQYSDKNLQISIDTFYYYHPNGQPMVKGAFANGIKVSVWYIWYDDGRLNYKCTYKEDNIKKLAFFHKNGEISALVEYQHDTVLINARMWDSTGVQSQNKYLEVNPTIDGEENGWDLYFSKHMYYPVDEEGIPIIGKVTFWILIDKFGKAHWGDVIGFAHPNVALSLERVVKKMPLCTPALHYNRPIDYELTINYNFRGDD